MTTRSNSQNRSKTVECCSPTWQRQAKSSGHAAKSPPAADPVPVFCIFEGYTDGTFDISQMERIDIETGETIWTHGVLRYPDLKLIGKHLRLRYWEEGAVADEYWIDWSNGEKVSEPELPFALCSTYDHFTQS